MAACQSFPACGCVQWCTVSGYMRRVPSSCPLDPSPAVEPFVIKLTVAEQRKIVEADTKEPCLRMWLTNAEAGAATDPDWTQYELSDGRVAIWRKQSDVDKLLASGERQLWEHIMERKLDDSVT